MPAPFPARIKDNIKGQALEAEIIHLCKVLQPSKAFSPIGILASNVSYVAGRDPELLKRITTASENDELEWGYWARRLGRGKDLVNGSQSEAPYLMSDLKSSFVISPLLKRIADHGGDISYTDRDRLAMESTVGNLLRDGGYTDPPEQLVSAVTMISYIKGLHTPESWEQEDGGYTNFADISTEAGYIGGRLEEVESMLPELRSRKAYDQGTIEKLRDSPSQVMRSGEL